MSVLRDCWGSLRANYVLELLALATAAAVDLDARCTDTLRTCILAGAGAATVALLLGAAIVESTAASGGWQRWRW